MPQVKIYGLSRNLKPKRFAISHAVHGALQEALGTPDDKRFQRFIMLESENFIYPSDRSEDYTIIEINLFTGRSVAVKKKLIQLLYQKISQTVGIAAQDLEITLIESAPHNWGIKGVSGDDLQLNYQLDA